MNFNKKIKIIESATPDLKSWDGLALAHYIGCVAKVVIRGSLGTLGNIMGRGLTIPYST
jgi:hypothetical protein